MIIGAGACYETRESQNAYNLVRLDFETGRGTIYLRMYSNRRGGFWTEDNVTYQGLNGKYEFDLPEEWCTQKSRESIITEPARMAPRTPNTFSYAKVGWWKKRGYSGDPFRWPDAADMEEKLLPTLCQKLHVDPKMPPPSRGVGQIPTFDKIASLDTSVPILIYAPTGGGKTFYRRWVAREILAMGEHALQIYNPNAKVPHPPQITERDLALCILKSIEAEYAVSATPIGEYVEHILDACERALTALKPTPQRVYIFLDNLQYFFYGSEEHAEQNARALEAISKFCTAAAKRSGTLIALRLFLPLSLRSFIQAHLDPTCNVQEYVIRWEPKYWRAIAERHLASVWTGRSKDGHLSSLLADDLVSEIDTWFKSQSQFTPRCVIKVLDRLVDVAYLSVKSREQIGIDVWQNLSTELLDSYPCADKNYPIETPDHTRELHQHLGSNPRVRIFISYSWKDEQIAKKIMDQLVRAGFECWLDQKDILIGEPLLDRVREGVVRESDYTLLILSQDSISSEWCRLELRMAYERELQQRRVVVLPIRINNTEIPPEVRVKKYYQLNPNSESSLETLVEEIRALIRRQS